MNLISQGRHIAGRTMHYVIVGGGVAGVRAAETIRKCDSTGRIIILSSENEPPYARHLLTEFLSGTRTEHSLLLRPVDFFSKNRIDFRMGEEVTEVDIREASVATTRAKYEYDRLLIATGGRSVLPRASLLNIKGVFVLRTLADARAIDSYLRSKNIRQAAVVGSGIVGLKVADALNHRGVEVSIVEKEPTLLPRVLDPESLTPVSKLLWQNGFKILLDERFREFLTSGKEKSVSHLVTYAGRSIPCQVAVMCSGGAPASALSKSIGLESRNGIVTDRRMGTSAENIFAAGDVVETKNMATGRSEVMPLWPNASEQGRIAGANMAGRELEYAGSIWQNSVRLFGRTIATLGQSHLAHRAPGARVLASPGLKQCRGTRLVFQRDRLIGTTMLDETHTAALYRRLIMDRLPAWDSREELLSQGVNLKHLYLRFGVTMRNDALLSA